MIDTINWLLFYGKTDPNLPDIFGHTALDIGVAIYEDVEDGVISIANRHSPFVLNRIRGKLSTLSEVIAASVWLKRASNAASSRVRFTPL